MRRELNIVPRSSSTPLSPPLQRLLSALHAWLAASAAPDAAPVAPPAARGRAEAVGRGCARKPARVRVVRAAEAVSEGMLAEGARGGGGADGKGNGIDNENVGDANEYVTNAKGNADDGVDAGAEDSLAWQVLCGTDAPRLMVQAMAAAGYAVADAHAAMQRSQRLWRHWLASHLFLLLPHHALSVF
ncbi:unnamed protein product [Closterium sp. Naga37s-1]|nr:unnamed protein product [Closterium sp. Naga37s-1]